MKRKKENAREWRKTWKRKMYKKRNGRSVKKKLFVKESSSPDNEEPYYVMTDNEGSADKECLYCNLRSYTDIPTMMYNHMI